MGSDSTTELFLAALTARDFAAVTRRFDGAVKAALPEDKLAVVWEAQVGKLGPLRSWAIVERAEASGLDVRVAQVTFERGGVRAIVSVRPDTQEIAGLFFKPVPAPWTSAPYIEASSFRSEEVSFGSEPFVLNGTITVPIGAASWPGVVLVHGSGPHDRDESIGANKPFRDLAEGLASRGVVVLRYDKRTFLHGRRIGNRISIDDEVVIDALAAMELLASRSEIDRRRVFVLGHSLGAQLAPEIALRAHDVAGAILLAPPGRAPWDAILAQLRWLETPASTLVEVEQAVAFLKADKEGGSLLGVPNAYWKDWASHDGVAAAKLLGNRPLLILHGERDYQVTDDDLATWRSGLRDVANVTFISVPSANHLFIEGTGKPGPAEYDMPGHVARGVIDEIVAFIARS
jgi:uncharacterized protein